MFYHRNCEGLLYTKILPLLLRYFHILRYNAAKRGRDFWDTLYLNIVGRFCRPIFFKKALQMETNRTVRVMQHRWPVYSRSKCCLFIHPMVYPQFLYNPYLTCIMVSDFGNGVAIRSDTNHECLALTNAVFEIVQ